MIVEHIYKLKNRLMKSILLVAVVALSIAACDTPQKTTTGTGTDTTTNRSATTDTTTNRPDSTRQQ
jgi:uncharacterized lipoprotein YajG